jgi:hypothetical protein
MYRKFKVTSYKTVPSEKFESVMSRLRQQRAINRPKLRRPATISGEISCMAQSMVDGDNLVMRKLPSIISPLSVWNWTHQSVP